MLKPQLREQKYPLQLVEIYWSFKEEQELLAVLSLPLWNIAKRIAEENKITNSSQFPEIIQRAGKLLALKALTRRNRSKRWICDHLIEAGVPQAGAKTIAHQMSLSGYANDQTLQGRILQEAERRGRGARWVELEMKKQRLDEEQIQAACQIRQEMEIDAICHWLQRQSFDPKQTLPAAQRFKIFQKLLRRGYKVASVEAALNRQN